MGLRGTRAGNLVVAALLFGETPDGILDKGAIGTAGATTKGHRDFVAAQDAAPPRLRNKIDDSEAPTMGAFTREWLSSRGIEDEDEHPRKSVIFACGAFRHQRRHLAHAIALIESIDA